VKFTVEPRLLDHFGIAMYNTVPKAIAELCANGYDADASRVDITYKNDAISILDNGAGMSEGDVQEHYLRLGRDRREDENEGGETTPTGRPIIGNKGIGKLAGFGIAQTMIVRTWRDGIETTITLDREELEEAVDLESFEIKAQTKKVRKRSGGTDVTLSGLLEDINLIEEEKLRAYLARHLPSRSGWAIFVTVRSRALKTSPALATTSATRSRAMERSRATTSSPPTAAACSPASRSASVIESCKKPPSLG
jgi:HSP90 family molecular chaperone